MNEIKAWWDQASSRDQMAVAICGVLVAIYILYAAILKPVVNMRDSQVLKNTAQQQALERVRSMAATWVAHQGSANQSGQQGSIVEMVDGSLRKHELKMSGMQPSGNSDVRLRLEQVPFDNLLAWLYDMEITQRVQVKDISVATGASDGLVSVNLRLHRE